MSIYHEPLHITEHHVWQNAAAALKWKLLTSNPNQPVNITGSNQKNYSNLLIFIDKENYEHGKKICINQQLIQLDFIADCYFLKCYETFAHTFIRIRKLIWLKH